MSKDTFQIYIQFMGGKGYTNGGLEKTSIYSHLTLESGMSREGKQLFQLVRIYHEFHDYIALILYHILRF